MSVRSRRQEIVFPPAENFSPARSAIGPVGPWWPGIHCGYTSVSGPGFTGIVSVPRIRPRGASVRSAWIVIFCAAASVAINDIVSIANANERE